MEKTWKTAERVESIASPAEKKHKQTTTAYAVELL